MAVLPLLVHPHRKHIVERRGIGQLQLGQWEPEGLPEDANVNNVDFFDEKNGGYWFLALKEITGVDSIPNEAAAWLAWGKAQGYRWEHAV